MDDGLFGFLIGLGLGAMAAFFLTTTTLNEQWAYYLVKEGVAHYEADPATGKVKFVLDKKEQVSSIP